MTTKAPEYHSLAETYTMGLEAGKALSAATVTALEAEVERLRSALQQVAAITPVHGMNPNATISSPMSEKFCWNVHLIAREALTGAGAK